MLNRREWMLSLAAVPAVAASGGKIIPYLERHKRPDGGYGWETDVVGHVTPTFAVVGCYRLLGAEVPDRARVAAFLRKYPVPERRRTERPLWRLDWEQVTALKWLREPVEDFVPLVTKWTRPSEFTKSYEQGGNPVFQHQALGVCARKAVGVDTSEPEWRRYFEERRRPNGTYNNTPAADGSDGHLMNTLWGVMAAKAMGLPGSVDLDWIRKCRTQSGGFSYAPGAKVDDIAYTWAALQLLDGKAEGVADWIGTLATEEGGYQDREGGEPNPLATFYALDCLRLLNAKPAASKRRAARAPRAAIPAGARVYSMQIQAPGQGSPSEAVDIAEALGIHLWTAKNAAPGWVQAAQAVARERKATVQFHPAGEDYGAFIATPGLGTYSHLIDWAAERDPGPPLPGDHRARFAALKNARGTLVWQFLENEELTRVMLDNGEYQAISTFHFGNENFLHSQPYLMRWQGRIPFIALQDAHAREPWWWTDMLGGFTTLYIATKPGWDGWLEALSRNHVVCARHDAVTAWKTHWAGGTPDARDFVRRHEKTWRWWGDDGAPNRRPIAAITGLRPGMRFEAGVPSSGSAVRVRLWADNNGQGLPKEARTELVSLTVDRGEVTPRQVETKDDRYYLVEMADDGPHDVVAKVRVLSTGVVHTISRRV